MKNQERLERGMKIITHNQDRWEFRVKGAETYEFKGAEIDVALDIMEILKTGDFEKAYQTLVGKDHEQYIMWPEIRKILWLYAGEEKFPKYVFKREHEYEVSKMTTEEGKRIVETAEDDFTSGDDKFDTVCEFLERARNREKRNNNIYLEVRGKRLYSLLDSKYDVLIKLLSGYKKASDVHNPEFFPMEIQRNLDALLKSIQKMPARLKRGEKIVDKSQEDWARCVKIRSTDAFTCGEDLDSALDIMEVLKTGDFEKAYSLYIKTDDTASYSSVLRGIIKSFSSRGEEFINYIRESESGLE